MRRAVILLLLAVLGLTPMPPEAPRPNRSLFEAAAGMTAVDSRILEQVIHVAGEAGEPVRLQPPEAAPEPAPGHAVAGHARTARTDGAVPRSSQGPPARS